MQSMNATSKLPLNIIKVNLSCLHFRKRTGTNQEMAATVMIYRIYQVSKQKANHKAKI